VSAAADDNPIEAYNSQIVKMIGDRIRAAAKPETNYSVFKNEATGVRIVLRDITEAAGYTPVVQNKSFAECLKLVNATISNDFPHKHKHKSADAVGDTADAGSESLG